MGDAITLARAGGPRPRRHRRADTLVNKKLKKLAAACGIRKRIAPHQLRHRHAIDLVSEGARVDLLSRQLGHANLGITTTYLAGVSNEEVVGMAHDRKPPTITAPDLLEVLNAA